MRVRFARSASWSDSAVRGCFWVAAAGVMLTAWPSGVRAENVAAEPNAVEQSSASGVDVRVSGDATVSVGSSSAPRREFPPFAEVVKDLEKIDGIVTVYRAKDDDPRHDPTRLPTILPKSLMGRDLLLATSISRGPMAGFQWQDYLVRFERVGRNVLISLPDTRYVSEGNVVSPAVARTYTPSFLAALPILTTTDGGDVVVDLGALLTGGSVSLPGAGTSGTPRRDLSRYTRVKNFADNLLIDVDLAFTGRGGGGQTVGLTVGLSRLPDLKQSGYTPRASDERVGYFTTARQDYGRRHSEREITERFINRWHLEKLDPTLDVSPPKEPIVFYVEKTVPVQWRRYVAEGVLSWNEAFERLGISDAIVVRQQTDTEYADLDPENVRHNFIRWVVTGRGFAMGPSRVDPRTGQILDADILFDDSMLRHHLRQFDVFGPVPAAAGLSPQEAEFLRQNPQFLPMGTDPRELMTVLPDPHEPAVNGHDTRLLPDNPADRLDPRRAAGACDYADGLRHELAMTHLAIEAALLRGPIPTTRPASRSVENAGDGPKRSTTPSDAYVKTPGGRKVPERFVGGVIKDVIAHEVGHTLGLRHNFKASTWLDLDEIRRRRDAGDVPTTASVMDYNPVLFFPGDDPEKVRHFVSPRVGPYDLWAIEYGYRLSGKDDGGEAKMLKGIASRANEAGLAYATDEETRGTLSPDPHANRHDMGSDPIAWATTRAELADTLLSDIGAWAVHGDEPRSELRHVWRTLFFEKVRNLGYVSRVIGGQHFNRARSGDPDATAALVPVSAERQRAALATLARTLFSDGYFDLRPEILNDLVPDRHYDWTSAPASRIDFPVHQTVLSAQNVALRHLLDPAVLQRVYDAELKTRDPDRFTAAELLVALRDAIWSELEHADRPPADVSSLRRNLQTQHAEYLLTLADLPPGTLVSADLQNTVRGVLRELARDLRAVNERPDAHPVDFATRAHYEETRSRIERVLESPHPRRS